MTFSLSLCLLLGRKIGIARTAFLRTCIYTICYRIHDDALPSTVSVFFFLHSEIDPIHSIQSKKTKSKGIYIHTYNSTGSAAVVALMAAVLQ